MIAEPYICIRGDNLGMIRWFFVESDKISDVYYCKADNWQKYAEFEREKLIDLGMVYRIMNNGESAFSLYKEFSAISKYDSDCIIDYKFQDYAYDSESSRFLKRAEFLKAVCEKEGVEWLPAEKWGCCGLPKDENKHSKGCYVFKCANNNEDYCPCMLCSKHKYTMEHYTKDFVLRRIKYINDRISLIEKRLGMVNLCRED